MEREMGRRSGVIAAIAAAIVGTAAGEATAQVTNLRRLRGEQASDTYGWAIGPAGDVDGDGIVDLLVGSPDDSTNGSLAGRVRVLSGRDGTLLREHFGDAAGDRLGWAFGKTTGDIDGDGFDDYVIGAPQTVDWLTIGYGWVKAISGRTGAVIRQWSGNELDSGWGERPLIVGDVDGDGHADVLVPAAFANAGSIDLAGAVYLYSGADGSLLWSRTATCDARLGWAACVVGDVDHDGAPDFAVGAPMNTLNGYLRGEVTIYSGRTRAVIHQLIGGVGEWFGAALADLGDVDFDGTPDLLIGSPTEEWPPIPGEAHVWSLASGSELYCLMGDADYDLFGYGVAGLGDIDGDGAGDFVVSQPIDGYWGPDYHARLHVYSGRRGRQLQVIDGGTTSDMLGMDVARMGDVDGDGLAEWVVGAPFVAFGLPDQPGEVWWMTSRDCHASVASYGAGWPGTLGVPSLAADHAPWLGESITLSIGNSSGVDTVALALMGEGKDSIPSSWGGTFLVAQPWSAFLLPLPAAGLALDVDVEGDLLLCGIEVDLQALILDPGASKHVAFTPGLELVLGGR